MSNYVWKHLPYAIYLDTNALRSAGLNLDAPWINELLSITNEYGISVCISQLVLSEWCEHISGVLEGNRQQCVSSMALLRGYSVSLPDSGTVEIKLPAKPELVEMVAAMMKAAGFTMIPNWDAPLLRLLDEAVTKRPPFDQGGKGLCDAVILESYAEHAKEDVPPKSVGGRPLLLTCRECNNSSGHLLDAHIRSGQDLKEMAEGRREVPIRLTQFGQTISAVATFGPGHISIAGLPKQSDPRAHEALFAELDRVAASGSRDWDVKITTSTRHSPQREGVGWLRVAYLYASAALGYQWVMRPELERIRDQFRRPDERLVPATMKHTDTATGGDGISFVYSPRELRSVLVRLDRNLFFFPNFNEASSFYDRLEAQQQSPATLKIEGVHIDLPTKPLFLFDHDPKLMILTVPLDKRRNQGGG
jgi:hypothetical protein